MQNLLPFESSFSIPEKASDDGVFDSLSFSALSGPAGLDFALTVLDSYRIKLSHAFDKLSSLSNSRTRLLPHQIEATHIVVNALRARFILADEVGLGKTIEAGLIIKELIFRKGYKKILIAVPAPLTMQWQHEMKSKFNEDFLILNRRNFRTAASADRIIASIDFIKNPLCADRILKEKWDIVVFDEAHRLRRDYSKVTHAYAFAEKIASRCESLLLLSATPFRGKLEELFYLIHLVDPHVLGPHSAFVRDYILSGRTGPDGSGVSDLREKIGKIMIRRRKVEVGGFTKRFAKTIRLELSDAERLFYDETTDYVRSEYNLAMENKNRAVGFIMIVFQKLLDSSTRALLRALEKRKIMLESGFHSMRAVAARADESGEYDFEEEADEDESPEETFERRQTRIQKSIKEMRREILTLGRLIQLGRAVRQDRKLLKLKDSIARLKREKHAKFIIFTQFRTTQDYLAENLTEYSVTVFHGSLSLQQKEDAVQEFKNSTEIFICTEAGGEGRNLQFADILFNYDLPWSPLKIEQRIGRVHRFGQPNDVFIFNFSSKDTVAERVLEVLEQKIKLFEQSIGPSDALLGAVEDEIDFQNMLMQFAVGAKTPAELDEELSKRLEIAESGYQKLGELVTPQCLDFNLNDYYSHMRVNRVVENEEVEKITRKYLSHAAGERYQILPPDHSSFPDADCSIRDTVTGKTKPASFRSEAALENENLEFLAIGHELVDRSLSYFLAHQERKSLITIRATSLLRPGFYFVYICRFRNGMERAALFGCHVDMSGRAEISEDIRPESLSQTDDIIAVQTESYDYAEITEMQNRAVEAVHQEARVDALELREKLHSVFKKEEYKIEISFGKKIRQLEEKREIHKMRFRMKPVTENKALLTRTENELNRAREELQFAINKIRAESRLDIRLELLQVYRIV